MTWSILGRRGCMRVWHTCINALLRWLSMFLSKTDRGRLHTQCSATCGERGPVSDMTKGRGVFAQSLFSSFLVSLFSIQSIRCNSAFSFSWASAEKPTNPYHAKSSSAETVPAAKPRCLTCLREATFLKYCFFESRAAHELARI